MHTFFLVIDSPLRGGDSWDPCVQSSFSVLFDAASSRGTIPRSASECDCH